MSTTASDAWMKTTNVYEVNVRQYTQEGSFYAFSKELIRLKDMGVETLWFMPVTPIAQKNKKGSMGSYYAAADYKSINPEFGNLQDFKRLVNTAHNQGFKVIIDWVANHTGWDHVWTRTHPEYFKRDESTGDFKTASGMDDIIEVDYDNSQMRKDMIKAMQFWIDETDIDGFRCDLAFWVRLEFWIEAKAELEKTKRLFWLGELDPIEHPDYMQVFDAAYAWTWMHKTFEFCQGRKDLHLLDGVLEQYQHTPGMKAWFTTNHDENTWNGTEYEKYGEAAKAFAVLSCTWPGVPLIYSGQELPNHKRLAFFDKDVIDWNGDCELHDFYKKLLHLHSQNPALNGDQTIAPVRRLNTCDNSKILAYLRSHKNHKVLVVLNLSTQLVDLRFYDQGFENTYTELFSGQVVKMESETYFPVGAWEYKVYYAQ